MKNHLTYILLISILASCGQVSESASQNGFIQFEASLHPAFNESSEIILSKHDTLYNITVLLKEIQRDDSALDTFYYKSQKISKEAFLRFDSALIQKTFIDQPKLWE